MTINPPVAGIPRSLFLLAVLYGRRLDAGAAV